MIHTLSEQFMKQLDQQGLVLETGQDPAPTKIKLDYYVVCEPSTGEPYAGAFEVPAKTSAQEIEDHLLEQLVEQDIL